MASASTFLALASTAVSSRVPVAISSTSQGGRYACTTRNGEPRRAASTTAHRSAARLGAEPSTPTTTSVPSMAASLRSHRASPSPRSMGRAGPHDRPGPSPLAGAEYHGHGGHVSASVLVVEDDRELRELIRRYLERA